MKENIKLGDTIEIRRKYAGNDDMKVMVKGRVVHCQPGKYSEGILIRIETEDGEIIGGIYKKI